MHPQPCHGRRHYGEVRIDWRCDARVRVCTVEVWWRDSLIRPMTLDATHRRAGFRVQDEAEPPATVEGELVLEPAQGRLELVFLKFPGGEVRAQTLCPGGPPVPPFPPFPPPPPSPEPTEALSVSAAARDLFPYLFLRAWPSPPAAAIGDRFVAYEDAGSGFYAQLLAAAGQPGARSAMQALALQFIAGTLPDTGPFWHACSQLPAPLDRFAIARQQLLQHAPQGIDAFVAQLARELDMDWSAIVACVQSPAYAQDLQQTWQSLFALAIELGYDRGGLAGLIETVVMAALLQRLIDSLPPHEDAHEDDAPTPLPPAAAWPPHRLDEGLAATVVLPAPVFPLPPETAAGSTPHEHEAHPRVLPFAIGEVQRVKERLLRYEAGDVAHIENLMPGERKTRRRVERERHERDTHELSDTQQQQRQTDGAGSDGFEQVARASLAAQFRLQYSTDYGPPTSEPVATGHLQLDPGEGDAPQRRDEQVRSQLARRVTQQAQRQYAQHLGNLRRERWRRDLEQEVAQVIDRRGHAEALRGVYRWLNAVHRCWVEQGGRRLVLELLLPQPARALIAARLQLAGLPLQRPLPPAARGVYSFEDVGLEPASPTYYATLAACYGIERVEPPPPLQQSQGVVFESDPPRSGIVLDLPDGYLAKRASALFVCDDAACVARLTAGQQQAVLHPLTADGKATELKLQDERGHLSLGLLLQTSAGSGDQSGARTRFTLTLQIESAASPNLLARWRAQFYAALQDAYRRQLDAWLEAAGMREPAATQGNALAWREQVQDELARGGRRALLRQAQQRRGDDPRLIRELAPIALWLERAIEWRGMSYALVDRLDTDAADAWRVIGADAQGLAGFLQAEWGRVLVPVAPGQELRMLFFLASGMVWDDADALTPTFSTPVSDASGDAGATRWIDLAYAWKRADEAAKPAPPMPLAWELMLPTSIMVLQDDDRLPGTDGARATVTP